MSLSLPSLPNFNFGSAEKLADVDILPEVIEMQRYFSHNATANLKNAVEFTYPGMTAEPVTAPAPQTIKPELNNTPTAPVELTYTQQAKNVANGALNGAVYHEQVDAAHVEQARRSVADAFGGPHVA